jgi:transmembrane sensor
VSTSKDDLQGEAARWLIQLDAGTADAASFESWRRADPRHAVALLQAQAAWEAMAAASSPIEDAPAEDPVDAEEPRVSRRYLLRAAAIAVPIVAVGGGALFLSSQTPAYASTGIGEQRRFAAGSGVTVELNTDSRIGWLQSGTTCQLWLERGEVALVLESQQASGAALHCGGREFMLAPGSYNIRLLDTGPDVMVIEGRAWLRDNSAAAQPGEQIRVLDGKAAIVPAPVATLDAATAWRRGEIVFNGQPLSDAIGEYNRYLSHKLVVTDPALARLRVGGRFETARPEGFLTAIESTFDLEAVSHGDTMLLQRKKAPAD